MAFTKGSRVVSFTTEDFEQVLDSISHELSLPAMAEDTEFTYKWASLLRKGEYTYWLPFDTKVAIEIRSSIWLAGHSAEAGEDSIRVNMVRWHGYAEDPAFNKCEYIGSKLSRYITRTKGWEERMTEQVRTFYTLRLLSDNCKCGEPLSVFLVQKDGPNKGRFFAKCRKADSNLKFDPSHISFKWIDLPQ